MVCTHCLYTPKLWAYSWSECHSYNKIKLSGYYIVSSVTTATQGSSPLLKSVPYHCPLAQFPCLPRSPTKSPSQEHYFLPRASPESWFAPSHQQLQDQGKLWRASCKSSHLQTLGHLPHGWKNTSLLIPAALNPFAEQCTCLLLWRASPEKPLLPKPSSVPYSESSTKGDWKPGCASRSSCLNRKSLSQCGGLLPPRWGSLSAPATSSSPLLPALAVVLFGANSVW